MQHESNYSFQKKVQPLKSQNSTGLLDCPQDPIERAYREQEQAFERLLARYLEIYRIADKRVHP